MICKVRIGIVAYLSMVFVDYDSENFWNEKITYENMSIPQESKLVKFNMNYNIWYPSLSLL